MAKREIILRMTPAEEMALAALLAETCKRITDGLGPALPAGSYEQLGNLNAAVNAIR